MVEKAMMSDTLGIQVALCRVVYCRNTFLVPWSLYHVGFSIMVLGEWRLVGVYFGRPGGSLGESLNQSQESCLVKA